MNRCCQFLTDVAENIDNVHRLLYDYLVFKRIQNIAKKEETLPMKEKLQKIYNVCLGLIPVCASLMLIINTNSTGCWFRGQDEIPASAKRYRKF